MNYQQLYGAIVARMGRYLLLQSWSMDVIHHTAQITNGDIAQTLLVTGG